MADRKVAELGQVVETIARTDVAEIKAAPKPGLQRFRDYQHFGVGAFLGAVAGVGLGAAIGAISTHNNPDSLAPMIYPILGGLLGFSIGSVVDSKRWAASHTADDVIYRAP